jgi:hypothetical protein
MDFYGTFSTMGPEIQNPRGSSGGYDHPPLGKLSYIINLVAPPKSPIID